MNEDEKKLDHNWMEWISIFSWAEQSIRDSLWSMIHSTPVSVLCFAADVFCHKIVLPN